jgi:hypothetical protein
MLILCHRLGIEGKLTAGPCVSCVMPCGNVKLIDKLPIPSSPIAFIGSGKFTPTKGLSLWHECRVKKQPRMEQATEWAMLIQDRHVLITCTPG